MRFSIIVPVFNKAESVRDTLESVTSQSFSDWELIIVDDGSDDASLEVVKSFISDAPDLPIHLISQENSGVSTARNNGVEASSGTYLCFLDADDRWESDFLEQMEGLIRLYPDAGIYGTSYFLVKNHNRKPAPIALNEGFYRGYLDYFKVYSRYLCQPLWTGAVCVPRDVFLEEGGFKSYLSLGEDFELWARIALKHKVAFLNEQLACYSQDSDNANRATKRLHDPANHFLWHVHFLEEEKGNADCKILLDKMRVEGLLDYYLSYRYSSIAAEELNKVDWSGQPDRMVRLYNTPKFVLWLRNDLLKVGSMVKRSMIKRRLVRSNGFNG